MQPICDPDERCVRVEVNGMPRWGRRDDAAIVLEDGTRVVEGEAVYLAPVRAVEDPRRSPHVPQPCRGVRGTDAATAVVFPQAADDVERPSWPAAPAERGEVPQLRRRARRRHRPQDEGCAHGRRALLRRGVCLRERRRAARLPARRPRGDAAREGAGRLPSDRSGARAGGRVRSDRLSAAHLAQRRGRPGGHGRRSAVPRRVPAGGPVPADHPRARRRGAHGDAGELAADGAGRRRRGRDRGARTAHEHRRRMGRGPRPGRASSSRSLQTRFTSRSRFPRTRPSGWSPRAPADDPAAADRSRLPPGSQCRGGCGALDDTVRPALAWWRRRPRTALVRRRALLARARTGGRSRARPHRLRAGSRLHAGRGSRPPADTRRVVAGARGRAVPVRSRRPRRAGDAVPGAGPVGHACPPVDPSATRLAAQARSRELPQRALRSEQSLLHRMCSG